MHRREGVERGGGEGRQGLSVTAASDRTDQRFEMAQGARERDTNGRCENAGACAGSFHSRAGSVARLHRGFCALMRLFKTGRDMTRERNPLRAQMHAVCADRRHIRKS